MVIFCFFDKNVWSSRFIRRLELNALYILFGFYINCTDFWGFPLDGVIDWWNRRVFFFISLICYFNVSFSMKNLTYLYQFKKMRLRRIMFGLSNSSRKLVKYNIKKMYFIPYVYAMLFFICIKDYTCICI